MVNGEAWRGLKLVNPVDVCLRATTATAGMRFFVFWLHAEKLVYGMRMVRESASYVVMKRMRPTGSWKQTARVCLAFGVLCVMPRLGAQALLEEAVAPVAALPDAPSFTMASMLDDRGMTQQPALPPPCPPDVFSRYRRKPRQQAQPPAATQPAPCINDHPLTIVVDESTYAPLTATQKGELAFREFTDPANLAVIALEAGVGVATNAHSAYGPGWKGFGKMYGYDLAQDAQGEFFAVYAIPALTHEDPRYRRMENAPVGRRVLHALSRTLIAQHDDGRLMPNYGTLLTYPISAELSNLYVPGIQTSATDTAKRVAIGYALDPVGNLVAEFLPDLARRVHVRSVFIQQIVNNMALNSATMGTTGP